MKQLKKHSLVLLLAAFPILAFANEVNINTASKDDLMNKLDGVSAQQAEAIIKYRENHGPFVKLPELFHIEGIDHSLIEPNYNRLTVGDVNWGAKKGS